MRLLDRSRPFAELRPPSADGAFLQEQHGDVIVFDTSGREIIKPAQTASDEVPATSEEAPVVQPKRRGRPPKTA